MLRSLLEFTQPIQVDLGCKAAGEVRLGGLCPAHSDPERERMQEEEELKQVSFLCRGGYGERTLKVMMSTWSFS